MASSNLSANQSASVADFAAYQQDAEAALRLYFSSVNPSYLALFAGSRQSEVFETLETRINETDVRSTLALLAFVEAAFRVDFLWRRRKGKKADSMSIAFRRYRKENVRLDEDILGTWCEIHPATKPLVGQLRGAFKFRHWLAHGRYWQMGNKYDFQSVYVLAQAVLHLGEFIRHRGARGNAGGVEGHLIGPRPDVGLSVERCRRP